MLRDGKSTLICCCARGADWKLAFPAWSASTVHTPGAERCTVEPETVHTPPSGTEKVTGSPEVATAETRYVSPATAPAGGVDVKLIACRAGALGATGGVAGAAGGDGAGGCGAGELGWCGWVCSGGGGTI